MYKHVLEYIHVYFLCQVTEPTSNYVPVTMNTFSLEFLVSSTILKLKKKVSFKKIYNMQDELRAFCSARKYKNAKTSKI